MKVKPRGFDENLVGFFGARRPFLPPTLPTRYWLSTSCVWKSLHFGILMLTLIVLTLVLVSNSNVNVNVSQFSWRAVFTSVFIWCYGK